MLIVASALSGCGQHEESPAQATSAAKPSDPQPIASVEAPDSALADAPAVATAKASVVRIRGTSPNCVLEGSGFVVAPNRVMTPADTWRAVRLSPSRWRHEPSTRKWCRTTPSATSRSSTSRTCRQRHCRSRPRGGGRQRRGSARLSRRRVTSRLFRPASARYIELKGPDIYKTTTVSREVYTIRGCRAKGISGGPLDRP